MSRIIVKNLGIHLGEALFQNVSFSFGEGDRVGVVGNNGAGKTTLLRSVAGLLDPTEGSIIRPKGSRLAFVEQTIPQALAAFKLREAVLDAIPEEERDASEWRAEVVLDAFKASEETRERSLHQLSGGWQRLALLGRAWVSDPDILVIDEPTNHLDLEKIQSLETWLNDDVSKTPVLMVSHDRRFLDVCTNRTLFLRPGESRMYSYPFSRSRELLAEDDRALENKKERELMEMQRLRKSAHTLRQIGVNNYSAAMLRKSIQVGKRADAIESSLPDTHVEHKRDIKLANRETRSKRTVAVEDVTICRPDGAPLFHINQLNIGPGDRVVLLGRNGTGKTQFVRRLLAGFADPDLARDDGLVFAPSLVMGYIDQNMSQLPDGDTLRGFVSGINSTGLQRATALLVSSGFPVSSHARPISQLSPGQKARLALLSLRLIVPSFYLMDEPTNHLDITGQEQLETEILNHEATAMFVSHDRAFVEHIGNRFLVVEDSRVLEMESPELFYKALFEDTSISRISTNFQAV